MEGIMEKKEEIVKKEEVIIIIAEDDQGHASLIVKNLERAGFRNSFLHFKNGQEVLDFLFQRGKGPHRVSGKAYLLLLDIRMPRVDGVEVLRQIKDDPELCKIPVIMVTTTDDPREVENCHKVGCSVYITKPVDYDKFVDAIRKLGLFLTVVRVPKINGET
ncbi:MAG: two-component response regulator [Candidatus Scalindua rubra]|uniref:Two-component response regulator n=1 Tax=Candidatus Scalindua rubra TaxID=1872076 RepID=A0A1E3XET8_9BACT|nr:MAG: two-component response regulator [Candidatus Scalindua rubra]